MTGYGFWAKNGAVFRAPNDATVGPTESFPLISKQGYGWVAFNVPAGEWKDERNLARQHGLATVAWMRCRTAADLGTLLMAKKRWGADAIGVNLEIEDTRLSSLMSKTLLTMSHAGTALVITDGWADPIGKWQGYKKWCGSTEQFVEDFRPYKDINGCVLHARSFFRAVVPMLGAYGTTWLGRKPVLADYEMPADTPHIVYCGDDVDLDDWSKW